MVTDRATKSYTLTEWRMREFQLSLKGEGLEEKDGCIYPINPGLEYPLDDTGKPFPQAKMTKDCIEFLYTERPDMQGSHGKLRELLGV